MNGKTKHLAAVDRWVAVQGATLERKDQKQKFLGNGKTTFRLYVETFYRNHFGICFSDCRRNLPDSNTKDLREATTEIFKGVMIGAEQMKAGKTVTEFPIDFDKVGQIIMIAIGMYVISAIFNFLQQFIMTRVSQRTVYELRRDLEEK